MMLRRAVTLVEVMVVVSIIGTLATLFLPSIQSAREAARANACRQNLHEIGLALHNYESAQKHFPKGAEGRFDRKLSPSIMPGLSWWADTLPHLEESDVADRLDRVGANTGWALLNAHNGQLADGFGPAFFFCPSSPVIRFVRSGDYRIACPSYTGISGATNHDGFVEERVSRGYGNDGQISGGGILISNAIVRSQKITDGLSKTLLVGEQSDFAYSQTGEPIRIGAGTPYGWLAGSFALGVPPEYGSWFAPSYNLTTVRYSLNEHRYELAGVETNLGANNPLLSPHHGTVNLLFGDGSVRAVEESLDVNILKAFATRDDGANTP